MHIKKVSSLVQTQEQVFKVVEAYHWANHVSSKEIVREFYL
jgi:hypothetical protein